MIIIAKPLIIPMLDEFFESVDTFNDLDTNKLSRTLARLLENYSDVDSERDELISQIEQLIDDLAKDISLQETVQGDDEE